MSTVTKIQSITQELYKLYSSFCEVKLELMRTYEEKDDYEHKIYASKYTITTHEIYIKELQLQKLLQIKNEEEELKIKNEEKDIKIKNEEKDIKIKNEDEKKNEIINDVVEKEKKILEKESETIEIKYKSIEEEENINDVDDSKSNDINNVFEKETKILEKKIVLIKEESETIKEEIKTIENEIISFDNNSDSFKIANKLYDHIKKKLLQTINEDEENNVLEKEYKIIQYDQLNVLDKTKQLCINCIKNTCDCSNDNFLHKEIWHNNAKVCHNNYNFGKCLVPACIANKKMDHTTVVACKYDTKCTNKKCVYNHTVLCEPVTKHVKLKIECKNGLLCTYGDKCNFMHTSDIKKMSAK